MRKARFIEGDFITLTNDGIIKATDENHEWYLRIPKVIKVSKTNFDVKARKVYVTLVPKPYDSSLFRPATKPEIRNHKKGQS